MKKLVSLFLAVVLLLPTVAFANVLEDDYRNYLDDNHIMPYEEVVEDENATVVNEYDLLQMFRVESDWKLKERGLDNNEINAIRSLSDERFASMLKNLSVKELSDRGLKAQEISSLQKGEYSREILRAASSKFAFSMTKRWSEVKGNMNSGSTNAAFMANWAYSSEPLLPTKTLSLAFGWGGQCSTHKSKTTSKVEYKPVNYGNNSPVGKSIVKRYAPTIFEPNTGTAFKYPAHIYNGGNVTALKGNAYVHITNPNQGIYGIEAVGKAASTTMVPTSLTISWKGIIPSFGISSLVLNLGYDSISPSLT